MSAYYNENDQEKAAVIRELIRANVVAPGDVDERSISDVSADDVRGYTQCHWFAGFGVWSYALRLAGWADDRDVWTGSCPCPSFSSAGKGQGFDDARHLWPDWARLIRECKPSIVFGEQADDAIGYGWLDLVQAQMEAENYALGKAVLASASVGAADLRERLYFVAESEHAGFDRQKRAEAITHCDQPGIGIFERDSTAGGMANSADSRQVRGEVNRKDSGVTEDEGRGICQSARNGEIGGMDNSAKVRHKRRGGARRWWPRSENASTTGRMGKPNGKGPQSRRERSATVGHWNPINATGCLGGFWRNAEWIPCRNPKVPGAIDWRPIEPGTFPLAHGVANRVLKLRGYGDAINAEVAKTFIEAYLG